MTNEIKEILDNLRIYAGREENGFICDIENYITNLQEENEKYKKMFEGKERFSKIMPDDMDFIILSKADYDRQQEDIELTALELKQRIDKAVEYLEAHTFNEYTHVSKTEYAIKILRGDE